MSGHLFLGAFTGSLPLCHAPISSSKDSTHSGWRSTLRTLFYFSKDFISTKNGHILKLGRLGLQYMNCPGRREAIQSTTGDQISLVNCQRQAMVEPRWMSVPCNSVSWWSLTYRLGGFHFIKRKENYQLFPSTYTKL